jgi:hypothetical protein
MAPIKDYQTRWLVGAGWVCCVMQLFLVTGLELDIKGWWWSELSVLLLFVAFPFGLALAITLLLLRRWLIAVLFLSLAIVTIHVVVKVADEVPAIVGTKG